MYAPISYILFLIKGINNSTKAVPLTVSYDTITLRKFRMWIHIQAVIFSLKHFGKSFKTTVHTVSMVFTADISYLVLLDLCQHSNYFNVIKYMDNFHTD